MKSLLVSKRSDKSSINMWNRLNSSKPNQSSHWTILDPKEKSNNLESQLMKLRFELIPASSPKTTTKATFRRMNLSSILKQSNCNPLYFNALRDPKTAVLYGLSAKSSALSLKTTASVVQRNSSKTVSPTALRKPHPNNFSTISSSFCW